MMDYTRLAKEWLRNYDDLYDPQVNDLAALLSRVAADEREACAKIADGYRVPSLSSGAEPNRTIAYMQSAIRALSQRKEG